MKKIIAIIKKLFCSHDFKFRSSCGDPNNKDMCFTCSKCYVHIVNNKSYWKYQ